MEERPAAPHPGRPAVLSSGTEEALQLAQRAERVAQWANRARDLANRPANDLTPSALGERAQEIAADFHTLTAEVFRLRPDPRHGHGLVCRRRAGQPQPGALIVLRYEPPDAQGELVLGLVGKAVTFDTGGISLK